MQQVFCILTPSGVDQFESSKAQEDWFLEIIEVHSHETDGLEAIEFTYQLVILPNRHPKLVPLTGSGRPIGEEHIICFLNVDNMVLTDNHLRRVEFYNILIVILAFTQRVVLIDIFHVGINSCGCRIALTVVGIHSRVAFGVRVILITFNDLHVLLIIV